MLTQEVCEGQGHPDLRLGLESGQGFESLAGLGFAHFGEVQVNEGGLEAAMAKVGGDLSDVHARFKQMGGVAVAEGVDDELGVLLSEATLDFSEVPDLPGCAVAHGLLTVVKGLLKADAGGFPATAGSGKNPVGIAVPGPKFTESGEEFGCDGDVPFVAAFGVAMGHAEGEALAVDVAGFEVEGFVETQAALVDGGEKGAVSAVAEGGEEACHFLAGEDVRERLFAADFDLGPDLPAVSEMIAEEGAQGADGLIDGGAFEIAPGLKVEEEVEDLRAFEVGQVFFGVMVVELLDPAEVGFGGSFAKTFELDKAGELLIPLPRSEAV